MEAVGAIILLIVGLVIFKMVLNVGARTAHAAGRAAVGKGTFAENMNAAFKGVGPIQARMTDRHIGDTDEGVPIKRVEIKGEIPVTRISHTAICLSIFDETDDTIAPVISVLDHQQEPGSIVFQSLQELPTASPGDVFVSWVNAAVFVPDFLQTPYSGDRDLLVMVRLIDLDNPPDIHAGFADGNEGILWQTGLRFSHYFANKGYQEAAEHREEAQALSVKIAVAVAMADGSLDDGEGEVISNWIRKAIDPFDDEKRELLRDVYNAAFKDAYAVATDTGLSLSDLTGRLNEIGEAKVKYNAIELCFEVMAADGVSDSEEMRVIRQIGEALDLDLDELNAIRDQKIVGLNNLVSADGGVEELLGIDPDWDDAKINAHLRAEFQKWNNRLNTLPEGEERDNAQEMLNLIAAARREYAS